MGKYRLKAVFQGPFGPKGLYRRDPSSNRNRRHKDALWENGGEQPPTPRSKGVRWETIAGDTLLAVLHGDDAMWRGDGVGVGDGERVQDRSKRNTLLSLSAINEMLRSLETRGYSACHAQE